jgi:monoterpene epsilon-lactone hydrolase
MNPLFEKYQDAPWLTYSAGEPSKEASEIVKPEMLKLRAAYPMGPGVEMDYLDDTTPQGITRSDIEMKGGNKLYIYKDETKHVGEDHLVFYLHGGGYIRGNGKYNRCNAMIHLEKLGIPVACCEYRLAPENREPAAITDVTAAYRYLVDDLGYDPAKMIIAGDSAGGCLALSLGLRIKANGEPMPIGFVLYSPSTNLHMSSESHDYNLGKDIIFPNGVREVIRFYADEDRLDNPDVSPFFGDFTGFPKTYFCAEDTEVLCSDTLECSAKMYENGVVVRTHIYHGLWHAFPALHPMPPLLPETDEVFNEIKGFLLL